ncbi:hypothetical protein [Calothrix sp. PCC 7507]|uniref:hypothetical protein n=1 Tax=Calothrix sp. PCC 7507 TaxID=99598 RepID=UPI0003081515|nr:hypothetical protein [Calothrix sp. PCC 7507]
MQPIEASELKAFILGLYQLDAPLPDDIQAQLKTIKIPADIGKLDAIAHSYPPLAKSYKQVWDALSAIAQTRSKGIDSIPELVSNPLNTEIDNSSREVEEALVEFDQQVDHNKLTEIARQIVQALNPVKTARDIIQTIFF